METAQPSQTLTTAWAVLPRAGFAHVVLFGAEGARHRRDIPGVTVHTSRDSARPLEQCVSQVRDAAYHRFDLCFVLQLLEALVQDISDDVAKLRNTLGC